MKHYSSLVLYAILFLLPCMVWAQTAQTPQPKIIVVPKLKANEDYRTIYDSNTNVRVAIAKINEALLQRGANLVSFDAKYRQLKENQQLRKVSGNSDDFKSKLLQGSSADIYVETEVNVIRHSEMGANSVHIILEAYQVGTGNYLGVKEGRSRINDTEDIGLLTSLAMDDISTAFLNLVQLKFNDIHENGWSIYVEFTIPQDADFNFDSEMGPEKKMLSQIIDEWFQKNTQKGVFNNQGVVSNMLVISDAHIPLKNRNNPQLNYTGQNFFTDIYNFLKSMNIKATREMGSNNKIIITLNKI